MIDIVKMIATPQTPHTFIVFGMKLFRRQGIDSDLIQLDGRGETGEKISDVFSC